MNEHHDYGQLKTFEITWMSGHVERIQGHQISWYGGDSFGFGAFDPAKRRVRIHGEIDGHWTLQLSALEDDIRTIRNLATEDALLEDEL